MDDGTGGALHTAADARRRRKRRGPIQRFMRRRARRLNKIRKYLEEKGYWAPLIAGLKFIVHFVVVMLLLYCSAIVFAVLEDPYVFREEDCVDESSPLPLSRNFTNRTQSDQWSKDNATSADDLLSERIERLWHLVGDKYNISENERAHFEKDVQVVFAGAVKLEHNRHDDWHHVPDDPKNQTKEFIFMKWFHFVTIASTTIGYGHVHPKTDKGKLFYIFFSIIGITLMMTLLRSCGTILNAINKRLYTLTRFYVLQNKKILSDELMAIFSSTFMFLTFMTVVVWHDTHVKKDDDRWDRWPMLDVIYFWIVTFTTVGFGDVHFEVEFEVNHLYELLFFRVFGLSFLAGIIDSIHIYLKKQKRALAKKSDQGFLQIKHMVLGRKTLVIIETREGRKNVII